MASALAHQQPVRRNRELEQPQRQPLRVLPGKRTGAETRVGLAPLWRMLFIAGIAMVLMVGTVWIARVCLANATMEVLADTAQITRATEAARAEGARLEVQYAIATNPSSIQEAAASQLGMSPDSQVDYLRASSGE